MSGGSCSQSTRQNPFQEREYQGHDAKNVYNKWYADQRYMKAYQSTKTLRGIDVDATMMGFNIENLTAKQALMDAKDKHARRWQTKEGTYRLKEKLLPDVRAMVAGFGQLNYVASCRSSTTEGASDVSPSHLFHFAYCTCRSFVVLGLLLFVLFVCVWFCVLHVQQASF